MSNTPFREYKHWEHEGGISTPLIAHWPAGITRERAGKLEAQPAHLIDLMPTLLDVAGAKHPAEFKGKPLLPLEGRSLMPAFKDQPLLRDTLFWEHEGNQAVRQADWKAVAKSRGPWELYDLKTDRTETHDLAAQHPDKARELAVLWKAWAERCGVWEWDNLQNHRHSRGKKKNKQ